VPWSDQRTGSAAAERSVSIRGLGCGISCAQTGGLKTRGRAQGGLAPADVLLLDAHAASGEPDGLYAVARSHKLAAQLRLFAHEGAWSKVLLARDLQLQGARRCPAPPGRPCGIKRVAYWHSMGSPRAMQRGCKATCRSQTSCPSRRSGTRRRGPHEMRPRFKHDSAAIGLSAMSRAGPAPLQARRAPAARRRRCRRSARAWCTRCSSSAARTSPLHTGPACRAPARAVRRPGPCRLPSRGVT